MLLKGLGVGSLQEASNVTIHCGPSTDSPIGPGIRKAAACMFEGAVILVPTGMVVLEGWQWGWILAD